MYVYIYIYVCQVTFQLQVLVSKEFMCSQKQNTFHYQLEL